MYFFYLLNCIYLRSDLPAILQPTWTLSLRASSDLWLSLLQPWITKHYQQTLSCKCYASLLDLALKYWRYWTWNRSLWSSTGDPFLCRRLVVPTSYFLSVNQSIRSWIALPIQWQFCFIEWKHFVKDSRNASGLSQLTHHMFTDYIEGEK